MDVGADARPGLDADGERTDGGYDAGRDVGPDTASGDMGPVCTFDASGAEEIPAPDRIHTPRWAFEPWISKDISDGPDTYAFVDGFIERDIPIGTVVLDSPWETNYNTLIPNPERYPDFAGMVSDMRDRNVRVVLWTTQFVNEGSFDLEAGGDTYPSPSPNYPEGKLCGYFVEDGKGYLWWKGKGAAIDFFNPDARAWWHAQQNALLDMGVAGWKLDFGDEYITDDPIMTAAGEISHQQYSEAYYRDFYEYGIHRNGHEDFVTMVRAWDQSYDHEGRFFARPEHAPVVWVGDNRRDWVGLSDALDHTFRSAAAGYVVIGSDLGGYMDRDDVDLAILVPFDRTNFMRWLAMSALTPFMQLHGRANLTPWSLPDDPDPEESVQLYRYWSHAHSELVPFFYSLAEEAYAGNAEPIIRPVGDLADWEGDYRYMLGDALLVAPILDASGVREVTLPEGTWFDWWSGEQIAGLTAVSRDFSTDLQKIPVFVKDGAVIPLAAKSSVTAVTEGQFDDAVTVLAWPAPTASRFVLHEEDGGETTLTAAEADGVATFETSRVTSRIIVRIHVPEGAGSVLANGVPLAAVSEQLELATGDGSLVEGEYIWVSVGSTTEPVVVTVQSP